MRRLYRLAQLAAGNRDREFRVALRWSLSAAVLQGLGIGALVGLVIELAEPTADPAAALTWLAAFVLLYLAQLPGRLGELRFQYGQWADVLGDLRLDLGRRLRTMPLRELERRSSGDLAMVVGGNVEYASMGASQIAFVFLQAIVVPVLGVVVVLVVDWRIGLVLLAMLAAVVPIMRRVQRRSRAGFGRVNDADAAAAARIVEYVQGQPVLRATGQTGLHSRRLDQALVRQSDTMTDSQRSTTVPGMLVTVVLQLGVVAAVALAAWFTLAPGVTPSMTLPVLAGLAVAAAKVAEPLAAAASMALVFELSEAALERVAHVMEAEPLAAGDPQARVTGHDVRFEHVSFSYGESPVLHEVTMTVPERSMTALVGTSGSGKTTIARLLTRYADPDAGHIRIGGVDLRDLDPHEIYRQVAVVFQDVYLFDDTIRANIAMARPDATDEEVEAAARAANVHDFVGRLPQGYDTRVGEIGGSLSGGERQRISIARAILKNAPVIVLDEPTAALDSQSEVAVQSAIDTLVADKTVLVIAHRLSTVVGADEILVVEDGRIVERGSHGELLDASGRYAAMWSAQTRARRWRVAAQ